MGIRLYSNPGSNLEFATGPVSVLIRFRIESGNSGLRVTLECSLIENWIEMTERRPWLLSEIVT